MTHTFSHTIPLIPIKTPIFTPIVIKRMLQDAYASQTNIQGKSGRGCRKHNDDFRRYRVTLALPDYDEKD